MLKIFNAILSILSLVVDRENLGVSCPRDSPSKDCLFSPTTVARHGAGYFAALSHPKRCILRQHRHHQRGGGKCLTSTGVVAVGNSGGKAEDATDSDAPYPLGPVLQMVLDNCQRISAAMF